MASSSETGFAKNVNTFSSLVAFCHVHANIYKPVNPEIALDHLGKMRDAAEQALEEVNKLTTPYSIAVDAQEQHFKNFDKLLTKVGRAYKVAGATPAQLQNVDAIIKKIKGERIGKIPKGKEEDAISTAQTSYASRINNFSLLLKALTEFGNYATNEDELSLKTLQKLLNAMTQDNKKIQEVGPTLSKGRSSRNKIIYTEKTGLYYIALLVKTYLRNILTRGTEDYKKISSFKFSNTNSI